MLRGHVEKRGKRYYTIVFEHGYKPDPENPTKLKRDREYVSTDITDKRKALERMDQIRLQRAMGTYVAPSKKTFGGFLDEWLESCAKPNIAPSTYRSYEMFIRVHIKEVVIMRRVWLVLALVLITLAATNPGRAEYVEWAKAQATDGEDSVIGRWLVSVVGGSVIDATTEVTNCAFFTVFRSGDAVTVGILRNFIPLRLPVESD